MAIVGSWVVMESEHLDPYDFTNWRLYSLPLPTEIGTAILGDTSLPRLHTS